MKIWEKNYLLTMGLVLCILFGSIFFIQQYSFRKNLDFYCEDTLFHESRVEYGISSILEDGNGVEQLKWYCRTLQKQQVYLLVESQAGVLADSRPFPWEGDGKRFEVVENCHGAFACVSSSYKDADWGRVNILYLKNMDGFYGTWKKQMALLLAMALALAAALATILYSAMKKIYAPVSNIAHELRTPLTAIQGYAQYILLGNIKPEDIAFASSQIDREAGHMVGLIENLLIMGNLQEGSIRMEQVKVAELLDELKQYFPFLETERQAECIYGEKTLLLSLMRNLVLNTSRQGEHVSLRVQEDGFVVYNKDDCLDKGLLDALNGSRPVPKETIVGKGLGVPLCREIVSKHHGSLQYQNMPQGGVEIRVRIKKYPRGS